MTFAPYQDENPDASHSAMPRVEFSRDPKRSTSSAALKYTDDDDINHPDRLPSPTDFENHTDARRRGFGNGLGSDERNADVYNTSLPMRLEIEACLAYVLLPPVGGAMLLLFEHKNDFVRCVEHDEGLCWTEEIL